MSARDQIKASLSQALLSVLVRNRSASLDLLFELLDEIKAEGSSAEPLPVPVAVPEPVKTAPAKATSTPQKRTQTPKKVAAPAVPQLPDLRTAEGRQQLDQRIYAAILAVNGGVDVPARDILVPGLGPDQKLAALKRLQAAGKVSVSGERAATRYSIVAAVPSMQIPG